jgi:glucokinase
MTKRGGGTDRTGSGVTVGVHATLRLSRAVLVDENGRVLARAAERVQGSGLADAVRASASAVGGGAAGREIAAAGLAFADPRSQPAEAALAALRGEHDSSRVMETGAAAAVAEAWCGAARGCRHVVTLSIGEETAAGILIDGEPWTGAHGLAGSAAWLALNPVERQDYRKFGCLDAEVSSRGIARRLVWRIQAGDHSAVLERAGDLDAITATHVFDGARSRDGVAISVVRDTAKYVGMAVANLAVALDPEIIVLGGAIAAAGDLLLDAARQEALRRIPPVMADAFRLEMTSLGDDAPAIGAARLAMTSR